MQNITIINKFSHQIIVFLIFSAPNNTFFRPTYVHCLTNIGSHPL